MQTTWIEYNGLDVNIDPKDGYEAVRGCARSLIVLFADQRKPTLVKIRHDSNGKTSALANGRLFISGFVHDYYIVYV